jgi:hypothetical protein
VDRGGPSRAVPARRLAWVLSEKGAGDGDAEASDGPRLPSPKYHAQTGTKKSRDRDETTQTAVLRWPLESAPR